MELKNYITQGNQRYYGVYITKDDEFACTKCKTVNPDMKQINKAPGKETFKCACGNLVTVEW